MSPDDSQDTGEWRVVRTLLKIVGGIAVLYLLFVLLVFGPFIFHDDTEVREEDIDRLLAFLLLDRGDVTITDRYMAPPGFSGDYSRGFCLSLASPPPESAPWSRGFDVGDAVDPATADRIEFVASAAQHEMPWVPPPEELLSDAYTVGVLFTGSDSAHIAYLDRAGDSACFVAFKM